MANHITGKILEALETLMVIHFTTAGVEPAEPPIRHYAKI